jgi:hypothetical protein
MLPVITAAPNPRRSGRILWATLAFMAGFAVLLIFISNWYLIPAIRASHVATDSEKKQLVASSRLLLALILTILAAGLLLTFRLGRYFVPRAGEKSKPTQYTDAWTESARRVSVPPRDEEDGEDEDDDN